MKIDDIKDPQIRALAWKYKKANKDEHFNEDTVYLGFDWDETREGCNFWWDVNDEKPVEITEKMKADHPEIFKQEDYFSHFEKLPEKELFGLWNEVCDEVGESEDKVNLTNNKQQEEMKKTHTLKNGTVLEVGKRYKGANWDKNVLIIFTEILYFGNKKALLRDNNGEEYDCNLSYLETLIPYEEPKEKIFEGYKPYIRHSLVSDLITLEFKKTRPLNGTHAFYYTLEEAKEQGLDLSIFNIK